MSLPPSRVVVVGDAFAWLDETPAPPLASTFTSLPDVSELPSRDLAVMLAEALRDMRDRDEEMDDETILVLIAAAIEANNRQIYADLIEMGVLVEETDDNT